ncbi:MAG: biopolymer transporter ExbD [Bacteriovoracaceae bacterium]
MIRIPSTKKRAKTEQKLNLTPIMDAVFIFIFFLLMSASFLKIYEIASDVPIISDQEPPKDQKNPLALTLTAEMNTITFSRGVPSRSFKTFRRDANGEFNYEEIHQFLVELKKSHVNENTIMFDPAGELTYEEIVKIMDAVRMLKNTDEAIYKKNKDGIDEKVKDLFSKIIFSNLMS